MKIAYCVECGAPYKTESHVRYDCPNGHSYWNNARAAAAVVLVQGDSILYAKRGREPRKGTYDLPGGFLDPGESIESAAAREVLEETGLRIQGIELIASYPNQYLEDVWVCDIVCLAERWEGQVNAQDDVSALEWKPIEFLNDKSFTVDYPGLGQIIRNRLS